MSRLAVASIVSGLGLLIGAPVVWHLNQPVETVGDLPTASTPFGDAGHLPAPADPAPATPIPDAEPTPDTEPTPGTEPTADSEPTADAEPSSDAETGSEFVEKPVRLTVPAISVDAPVVPVGLEDDGGMEIPHDVATVGWYEPGVMPGETGTAVLSGHVDSREQGRGAFWALRTIDVGDVVRVDHHGGTTTEWNVTARTVYDKDELPIADIFTRFGDTRLVLITCGGAFNTATRRYEDNVVVYTEPVESPSRLGPLRGEPPTS